MINKKSKIFVAGHAGMVGSSILRKLKSKGFSKIIICEKKNLDLLNQNKVFKFLKKKKTRYSNYCSSKSRWNSCKFYF